MVEQLFGRLVLGLIPLELEDWAEISALWLVINYWGKLQANNPTESLNIVYKRIMPLEKKDMIKNKQFLKVYLDTCGEYSKKITGKLT